ncbi:MAG TPA: hydrogenase maturation protease [Candidatus Limnocylindrales bacterium]
MSRADGPLLALGIGNILLRDEGLGVLVARTLAAEAGEAGGALPPGTEVVDGGTLGLDLLPRIEDARAVLLIDAVDLRRPAGSIALLEGDALHGALAHHVSPHQVGVSDLLGAARLAGTLPERVALVGVQPASIEIGLEPSAAVAAALPEAVALARRALWDLAA